MSNGNNLVENPACSPLYSVKELSNWQSITCHTHLHRKGSNSFTCENGKYVRKFHKDAPKTLVCHDMKGGYLDDRFINGCCNSKAYTFIQWNYVDIFVYFSHHFITIPPPCWIHAGHIHGVPVLGTLITEWDDGAKICEEIFASKQTVDEFVDKLTALTFHYNFDGWLINIENKINKEHVENITYFLQRMKRMLNSNGIRDSIIVWYDSVTKDGKLDWQNELNEKNKPFFNACDAIFLNYTWKETNLENSVKNCTERTLDIFVGIDIFGRNCYGGGGFNTYQALSLVRKHGLSAALFAPGWLYELHDVELFPELSAEFWLTLLPFLSIRGPASLPIQTSFCQGFGSNKFKCGQVISSDPWHNMSHQQLQSALMPVDGIRASKQMGLDLDMFTILKCGSKLPFGRQSLSLDEGYHGGGCLELTSEDGAVFPLFFCEVKMTNSAIVAFTFKGTSIGYVNAVLNINQYNDQEGWTVICPLVEEKEFPTDRCGQILNADLVPPNQYPNFNYLFGDRFQISSTWETRLFRFDLPTDMMSWEVNGVTIITEGKCHHKIGFFGLYQL